MIDLFGNINIMGKLLDVKLKRHQLLTNNLANVDTPNFKRSDISFEDVLKDNLNKNTVPLTITNEKHIKNTKTLKDVKPKIYNSNDRSFRNDKNNVDIDREMVNLMKNTLSYNIIADQLQRNFRILQTAISEGRK